MMTFQQQIDRELIKFAEEVKNGRDPVKLAKEYAPVFEDIMGEYVDEAMADRDAS